MKQKERINRLQSFLSFASGCSFMLNKKEKRIFLKYHGKVEACKSCPFRNKMCCGCPLFKGDKKASLCARLKNNFLNVLPLSLLFFINYSYENNNK